MAAPLQSRVNNFDLLRLLAASQVVLTHSIKHLHIVPEGAWAMFVRIFGLFPGVSVFFVISGFLISKSYESKRNDLKTYARARALRIFPGMWGAFVVSMIVMVAAGVKFGPSVLPYTFAQLTFFQFWVPNDLKSYGIGHPNGSLWTIPVEMQFYIVLPIAYWLAKGRGKRDLDILLAVLMVGSYLSSYIIRDPATAESMKVKLFHTTFVPHIWLFFAGALIQRNFDRLRPYLEGKALLWCLLFIPVKLALETTGKPFISSSADFILALAVVSLAFSKRELSEKTLRGVDISYGVYLYHMVVINYLVETGRAHPGWPVAVAWAATVVLAILSYLLIERPALRLKSEPKTTPTPASA